MEEYKEIKGFIFIDEKKGKKRASFLPANGIQVINLTDIKYSDFERIGTEKKNCIVKKTKIGDTTLSIDVEINKGNIENLYKKDEKNKLLKGFAHQQLSSERRENDFEAIQNKINPEKNVKRIEADCIDIRTVTDKTRLPYDTRNVLHNSSFSFDNFSLKLNKASRFDCRVQIEKVGNDFSIPDFMPAGVSIEDENHQIKYLFVNRPLTIQERDGWLNVNPISNTDDKLNKISKQKIKVIKELYTASQYVERRFEFYKAGKKGVEFKIASNFGGIDFEKLAFRQKVSIDCLNLNISVPIYLVIDWRLIVGLGNQSVYETSIILHHIYGIPYIPASSIKGVVRNWIITECFGANEEEGTYSMHNAEYRAYCDKGFCLIFGCPTETKKIIFENGHPKQKSNGNGFDKVSHKTALKNDYQGNIVYFDSFMTSEPEIEVDIMNSHYQPYYSAIDNTPPADYHQPNPRLFLTVGSKDIDDQFIKFQFIVGINPKNNKIASELNTELVNVPELSSNSTLLEIAEYWLKKALSEHGIGAKTAVGYGYFGVSETGGKK